MISPPQLLIAFRAGCAPLIVVLAYFHFPGPVLAAVLGSAPKARCWRWSSNFWPVR